MESSDAPELVPESMEYGNHGNSFLRDAGFEMWPEYCNPSYVMPELIEVKVTVGADSYFFPVTVVKNSTKKSYVGGYRNKLTGHVYHHASTQTPTDQQQRQKDYSSLRSRETQTVESRTLSVQSYRESGTQMERIDLHVDNKRDKVKYSKPYFTSDELLIKKKAGVITMQRYWRGYMARCRAESIRQRNIDYKDQMLQNEQIQNEMSQKQRIQDMKRRTHPKSNQDFAVLYNELDNWRQAEITKIKTTMTDPEERRLAMADLLTNETKALQSLQQLKQAAQKEIHHEKTEEMLKLMAQPLVWQLSHGEQAMVHTPETQRAKQLLDLFNSLHAADLTTDQRLEVLLNVKWMVNETPSSLSEEIKSLVDREADLLSRNRPLQSMEKLRVRLNNLFLQFLQNPKYNPRASDFIEEK